MCVHSLCALSLSGSLTVVMRSSKVLFIKDLALPKEFYPNAAA